MMKLAQAYKGVSNVGKIEVGLDSTQDYCYSKSATLVVGCWTVLGTTK